MTLPQFVILQYFMNEKEEDEKSFEPNHLQDAFGMQCNLFHAAIEVSNTLCPSAPPVLNFFSFLFFH